MVCIRRSWSAEGWFAGPHIRRLALPRLRDACWSRNAAPAARTAIGGLIDGFPWPRCRSLRHGQPFGDSLLPPPGGVGSTKGENPDSGGSTVNDALKRAGELDGGRLLSTEEVAALLGISPRKVLLLPIPRIRFGPRTIRYRKMDLDAFVAAAADSA